MSDYIHTHPYTVGVYVRGIGDMQ
eukprot:COSAG05_NODE_6290_length_985_cov_1.735892_2_plen_23_part_01